MLLTELGPFGHVVGSDLVYGAKSRCCALLDTLQALAEAQEMLEAGQCRRPAMPGAQRRSSFGSKTIDDLWMFL